MVERQLISLASQLQLIDRLQHLIYLSSSFIFLSGEQGGGKSILVEQLSNKLPDNIQQVFIALNDQLSDAQIRHKIIMQLYQQPLFDEQDRLFTSISQLQEKHKGDIPRLIILDRAHHLSDQLLIELLQLITHKEQFGESDINVLLLASEDDNHRMRALIDAASLSQEQKCACLEFRLDPLSGDEASSLLNHIFQQLQYQPKIQHQDALHKQLLACAGIPQKIINLAEKISASEFDNNELSWLKIRFPAIVFMLCLLITVAGLASYLYPKFSDSLKPAVEVAEIIEDETVLLSEISDSQLVGNESSLPEALPELVEKLAGSWPNKVTAETEDDTLPLVVSDEVDPVIISEQEILTSTDLAKEAVSGSAEVKAMPVIAENLQSEVDPISEVQQADKQELAVVAAIEIQESAASEPETVSAAVTEKIEAAAVKNSAEVIGKKANSIFTASAQLLARSPAHFTLQLSAMESEKSLKKFVVAHKLPQPDVYVYQTIRNNKPWYVVIFGDYKSLSLAKKAGKRLPGTLARMNPWIKKYQLVHQDLQINNE